MSRLHRFGAAIVLGAALLAGCGGPIDPDRPPLYDYEFEPIHEEPVFEEPSRV